MTSLVDELADALEQVLPAVSRNKKHPAAMHCVLVERAGDIARVVATDTYRLVVSERPWPADLEITRVLLDPTTLAAAQGVDDEFPDYERLLVAADGASSTATVDAAELLEAVEEATDDDAPLAVELREGRVLVGTAASTPTVHVDPRYLHDAVEAVMATDCDVVVEATTETAPLALRGADVLTLLMPVRVRAGR
jgi:hypothetical protein